MHRRPAPRAARVGPVRSGSVDAIPADLHPDVVADRIPRGGQPDGAQERRLRRSWLSLVVAFGALALLTALRLVAFSNPLDQLDLVVLGLVLVVGIAGLFHRRVIADLEQNRRLESESFQRILRGLSRSVSHDAIVEAIVEDLGVAAGADHTVVVRLRADARILEATLVSSRAGVPSSTTMLPLSDLEDPGAGATGSSGRPPVAIPIEGAPVALHAARRGQDQGPRRETRPFHEWAAEATPAPQRRGAGAFRASLGRRETDAEVVVGPPAAAQRIAEQIAARVSSVYGLKNTLSGALVTEQGVVGAIVLSRRTTYAWSQASTRLLRASAEEASAALARAYSYREVEARASTDALTGLPNRGYFDEFCGLLARRRRADDAVGVLMIDIDHFKRLNDEFGHPVGDQVLRAVAAAITGAVREGDVPARFGGEEFAVLLRNPGREVAMEVGERVRAAVGALDLSAFGPTSVTVSVGVAIATSADQPIADLVEEADQALYRAKRTGRDRVVAA
jgi:diguanylate cyclase (GGDEF)-like protein